MPLELPVGYYDEDFLRHAAEPHVEAVHLLAALIASTARNGEPLRRKAERLEPFRLPGSVPTLGRIGC